MTSFDYPWMLYLRTWSLIKDFFMLRKNMGYISFIHNKKKKPFAIILDMFVRYKGWGFIVKWYGNNLLWISESFSFFFSFCYFIINKRSIYSTFVVYGEEGKRRK